MGWQPIENAPKDETTLMVWVKGGGLYGLGGVAFGRAFPSGTVKADGHTGDWTVTHWWDFGDGKTMPDPPA